MKIYKQGFRFSAALLCSLLLTACDSPVETSTTQIDTGTTDPVIPGAKPTVSATTQQIDAVVGDTFTVDIAMSNFPASEGGGVSVQFDPAMMNASNVSINSADWDFVNKTGTIDNSNGVISDILFSSFKGASGDSHIATITFNAISSGNSQIILSGSSINPFSSNGSEVPASFINVNVKISIN